MPSISSRRRPPRNCLGQIRHYVARHLNFYRIHLLFFTFTPLIFSGIFQASNGSFKVAYIDSLFNCVSAMTVCGLATVDLSGLTSFQQFLLFAQMCLGSPVVVSWVMVYTRRSFFAKKFRHIMKMRMAQRLASKSRIPVRVTFIPWWRRAIKLLVRRSPSKTLDGDLNDESHTMHDHLSRHTTSRVRPDMIRRVDDAPKLINPSGWISEGKISEGQVDPPPTPIESNPANQQTQLSWPASMGGPQPSRSVSQYVTEPHNAVKMPFRERRTSDPGTSHPFSVTLKTSPMSRFETINVTPQAIQGVHSKRMPRTQTVEFAATPRPLRQSHNPGYNELSGDQIAYEERERGDTYGPGLRQKRTISLPRTATQQTYQTHRTHRTMHRDFGGFPMPHEIAGSLLRKFFPDFQQKMNRTMTIPPTRTIGSQTGAAYLSFEAVVGRNSTFRSLTREQLEELGGVEYRALSALLWIVGGYHIITQLLAFIVIAPYMSIPRWRPDFEPPIEHRDISPVWYSGFQVVSAYTNTGMSLQDLSLVPFQTAYPMIVITAWLILAGNTAFPVFLRLTIWVISKLVPLRSRIGETIQFLLDHPRRCFVYLFPSHQTWFLLAVLIILNGTDWFFFLILDIGNPAVDSIPAGIRVIIGFLQATAVRAAGFATVALSSLAPAVKVLYVIMMYISVYPVAMTVRSTNVYEERSLGVFANPEEEEADDEFNPSGNRVKVWGRYVAMHMRKQLSFDMWWLGLALFLVCIIERSGLNNAENATWFNIFSILFELVSAYGSVGLSLGLPYANYSFSGALQPLSKLIICAVMLRGRHRGLPVAIDRAVMLPFEFQPTPQDESATTSIDSRDALNETQNNVMNGDVDANLPHEKAINLEVPRRNSIMPTSTRSVGEAQRRTGRVIDEEELQS